MRSRLLWIDCLAGSAAGVVMLLAGKWLSDLYGLPWHLLLFLGAMNLVYASYSLSLAAGLKRSEGRVKLLAIANVLWASVCLALSIVHYDTASIFGLGHLIGEGLFVAGLGFLEWRWIDYLVTR